MAPRNVYLVPGPVFKEAIKRLPPGSSLLKYGVDKYIGSIMSPHCNTTPTVYSVVVPRPRKKKRSSAKVIRRRG